MVRCKDHPPSLGDTVNGCASCQECGDNTWAQRTHCERCCKFFDICEVCGSAADSDINPALVAAFSSTEAAAARKLCKDARAMQKEAYSRCLADVYQGLIGPAQKKLEAAVEPLKLKLQADLEGDPLVQQTEAAVAAVRALPWSEEARAKHVEAMNAFSAATRPHDEAFRTAKAVLVAAYQVEIAPFEAVHKAVWEALQASTQAQIDKGEATLTSLIEAARTKGK